LKKEKENDKKKDSTDHFTQNVLRNLWENARLQVDEPLHPPPFGIITTLTIDCFSLGLLRIRFV
jgi:hypothetical protein